MTPSTKHSVIIIAAAALAYALYSLAWPLQIGRDFGNYILYFADFFNTPTLLPFLMLYRMPLPAFFLVPFLMAGPLWSEVLFGLLYITIIYCVFLIGRSVHPTAGWLASGAVLMYPPLGGLMHSFGAEALFATLWALWSAYYVTHARSLSMRTMIVHAICATTLVFIKPIGQVALLFAIIPWLMSQPRHLKIKSSLVFIVIFIGTLGTWSLYNLLRFQDFTVARGGTAQIPLYRTFVIDRIVQPTNGPASTTLAQVVSTTLLQKEPYLSRQISPAAFFALGDPRMFYDLIPLSDTVWGWKDDYALLRRVGLEAIAQHPRAYLRGVLRSFGGSLILPYHHANVQPDTSDNTSDQSLTEDTIPASHHWWLASSPDNRSQTLWVDENTPTLIFRNPSLQKRLAAHQEFSTQLQNKLPVRSGNQLLSNFLNRWSTIYPPIGLWLLMGSLAFFVNPRSIPPTLIFMNLIALGMLLLSFSGVQYTPHLRIPFDAIFITTGMLGAYTLWLRILKLSRSA